MVAVPPTDITTISPSLTLSIHLHTYRTMNINNLPPEMLFKIARYFQYDLAEKSKSPSVFGPQDDWNKQCLEIYRALCLTCRHLQITFEPYLYSVLWFEPGCSARRLACFLRTIVAEPLLQKHLKHIHVTGRRLKKENAQTVITQNTFPIAWCPDTSDQFRTAAQKIVQRFWDDGKPLHLDWKINPDRSPEHLLGLLILALNSHAIKDVSYYQMPAWMDGGTDALGLHSTSNPPLGCGLNFTSLGRLGLYKESGLSSTWYFDFSRKRFPNLNKMFLRGRVDVRHEAGSDRAPLDIFSSSDREDDIAIESNPSLETSLQGFSSLRILTCNWLAFRIPGDLHFGSLYAALSAHKHTLQRLRLVLDKSHYKVDSKDDMTSPYPHLGSFRDFTSLINLEISPIFLFGAPKGIWHVLGRTEGPQWNEDILPFRLAELLPPSLKNLDITNENQLTGEAFVLNQLAEDCALLPNLRSMFINNIAQASFTKLRRKFAARGVELCTDILYDQRTDQLVIYRNGEKQAHFPDHISCCKPDT
jgi:hypothetical protein